MALPQNIKYNSRNITPRYITTEIKADFPEKLLYKCI